MFFNPTHMLKEAYISFWDKLGRGEFDSGEYKRLCKSGKDIYIQATDNPIFDVNGKPIKIVKFVIDVTESQLRNSKFESKVNAVDKGQAVIEFNMDSQVLTANENFQLTLGYSLREMVDEHVSMFCSPDYIRSQEYRDYWLRFWVWDAWPLEKKPRWQCCALRRAALPRPLTGWKTLFASHPKKSSRCNLKDSVNL